MENEERKNGLRPIIDGKSKILILGSLPSDESIKQNEYYASRNNQFWKILIAIFSESKELTNYSDKITFLRENNIALWDVYNSANRISSNDVNIKNGEFNNLKELLTRYPNITTILLNGKTAKNAFEEYMKKENFNYNYVYVPSTSGVNTNYTLDEKIELWKKELL